MATGIFQLTKKEKELLRDNDIPADMWLSLLEKSPHATPFQTPEFYSLINSVSGMSGHAFAVAENDKLTALAVAAVFAGRGPVGFFSRRAIIYGGPLLLPGEHESLEPLLGLISGVLSRKAIYIETRNYSDYGECRTVFGRNGWSYVPYLDIRIDTADYDSMTSALSASRRRQIRKGAASGAEIKEAVSLTDVEAFYRLLKDHYDKRVRKPLMPAEFFIEAFRREFGKFLLVCYGERIIGGIFCPLLEGRSIYEFYVCGLDHEFRELYPSVMATWAAMEYASRNGIPFFDLMGAGKPGEDYGVREFKTRFGGRQEEFGRYLFINKPILYRIGRAGVKMMGKLTHSANTD